MYIQIQSSNYLVIANKMLRGFPCKFPIIRYAKKLNESNAYLKSNTLSLSTGMECKNLTAVRDRCDVPTPVAQHIYHI